MLYPFVPARLLEERDLETAREFFASQPRLVFGLRRLAQWESGAVYAVPEPDDELRATMRALWKLFPECPPYGGVVDDPPPHASLTLSGGDDPAATLERAERRLDGILPVRFEVDEASLIEEYEPDRWHVRETFSVGSRSTP
jgi:hypothetical protein